MRLSEILGSRLNREKKIYISEKINEISCVVLLFEACSMLLLIPRALKTLNS